MENVPAEQWCKLKEHRGSCMEWYAQSQHEVAAKHIYSVGATYRLKKNWRLGGQENEKERGHGNNPKILSSQFSMGCSLPGSIAAGCFSSKLSKLVTGLMYVPDTRTNIPYCYEFALTGQ